MTDIPNASRGVKLALLEGQLLSRQIDRDVFVEGAMRLGLSWPVADAAAGKCLAIAANQVARRADLKSSYDYIVIGSGASGAVVARRLAENPQTAVLLLLEAGGEDLKPSILMTESWFFNQGTDVDWAFQAEPSKSVNNRSIKQAMGKALGGGTSINGMVWARGHKNDFDDWAKQAGDEAWGYRHVLDIYKRIEDWQGVPDPERRGRGGNVIGAGLWEPHDPLLARRANAAEANLFVKSRPDLNTPDLHIWHIEAPYVSEVTAQHAVGNAWSISPGLVRPESRGLIKLKSADPREAPEIHANMLADPRDLAALRKGMEISRELGNSEAMKPFVKREILPGDRKGEALDNLIRDRAMSMHHPTCTAKMGQDDLSVVDAQLRVYGVRNLRIADGSIMPTIASGNTQAPCVIIGERLAEILKA
jgi:choline dehydrogenase-like flavoprotein